eukprot:2828135-Prymnesium_polylepis.2
MGSAQRSDKSTGARRWLASSWRALVLKLLLGRSGRCKAREAADPGRDHRNGRRVVLAVFWSIRGVGTARPERSETVRACMREWIVAIANTLP